MADDKDKDFGNVAYLLKEAFIENICEGAVEDTIKENADFHYQAGMKPRIVRTSSGYCCEWCSDIEGVHEYPDVPKEVFELHRNDKCIVTYDPADGKVFVQNAHTKQWTSPSNYDNMKLPEVMRGDNMGSSIGSEPTKGEQRAAKYGNGWQEASLDDTVNRLVPNPTIYDIKENGNAKRIYESVTSSYSIIEDIDGKYFRIKNSSLPGKKESSKYVGLNGEDVHNIEINGKIRGRSKSEYRQATHFKIREE